MERNFIEMNILDKFEGFEIKQEDKISKEDKENCEKIQSIYEKTLSVYKKWYDIYHEALVIKGSHDYYGLQIKDLSICNVIRELHRNLIYQIYNYFSSKYKLKLEQINTDKLNFNYHYHKNTINTEPINHKLCVDDILKQLGGLSFEGMRIKQLKEKLKDTCQNRYSNKWNIEIKGDTVKFSDLFCWTKYSWEDDYYFRSLDKFLLIESALSFFEYGKEIKFIELSQIREKYSIEWSNIESNIKINSQKIKSIKLFKNGRVDIKFSSPELARKFAENWCGYTL